MKKYNSITISLILLGVLANSCGTALAESSEPFPDEEWNRTDINETPQFAFRLGYAMPTKHQVRRQMEEVLASGNKKEVI